MPSTQANGITIEYETAGNESDPPLLLVHGLGAQLVAWENGFVQGLVDRGRYVIRFDNRDVGKSTWFDQAGPPDFAGALAGNPTAAYLLGDMAADTAGLLDALDVEQTDVLGVSLGGMIAQQFLLDYPARVRSLVSIMSTTGDPTVGQPHPEALEVLLAEPPHDRDGVIEAAVTLWQVIGSPGFPFPEDRVRAIAGTSFDRGFHPVGTGRQLLAMVSSPDRTSGLRAASCPALVMHGEADILVDPSGGRATAAAIPGATLHTVPGMGHSIPEELWGETLDRMQALWESVE